MRVCREPGVELADAVGVGGVGGGGECRPCGAGAREASADIAPRLDVRAAKVAACESQLKGRVGRGLELERAVQASDRIVEVSRAQQTSGLTDQGVDQERRSSLVQRLRDLGGAGVVAQRLRAVSALAPQLAAVVERRRLAADRLVRMALEQRELLVVALCGVVEAAEVDEGLCAIAQGPGDLWIVGRELGAIRADRAVMGLQRLPQCPCVWSALATIARLNAVVIESARRASWMASARR